MGKTELETYVQSLLKSGLVSKEQVTLVLSDLGRQHGGPITDENLAAEGFVKAGHVTPWQNEKLLKGRFKGFFLGNYKLLHHIASGGMSNIYLAEHLQMRRRVAIKVLPPSLTRHTSYLDRFYVESRAIAALDHPNIVRAYDIAKDGNFHYLVLEYVDGCDLRARVHRDGPMPSRMAADFIRQSAAGLHHAHEKGIIHRDIKPANLLVDSGNVVKILDMGLTRFSESAEPSLTLAYNEKFVGTVDYIAPEQAINSHEVDRRADIYSLGCTFYFLLTGRPPFPEGTQSQRLMQHQFDEPEPLTELRPEVTPRLAEICSKMMAKKPDERYQTSDEVFKALDRWLAEQSVATSAQPAANPSLPPPPAHVAEEETNPLRAGETTSSVGPSGAAWAAPELSDETDGSLEELEARRQALDARAAFLAKRESELIERESKFQEFESQRANDVKRQNDEIQQNRGKLEQLEVYLENKAKRLDEKEESLEAQESELLRRREEIAKLELELDQRKRGLMRDQDAHTKRTEAFELDKKRFHLALEKLKAQHARVEQMQKALLEREARIAGRAPGAPRPPAPAPGTAAPPPNAGPGHALEKFKAAPATGNSDSSVS